MQEKVEEIRLSQENVNLAIKDANAAAKVMYEIYDRIVDLKAFASKGGHKKMQDLITALDKAHGALNRHLGE